ncbi:MAG TPA: DNA-formamidopyrimidine glycosylase family protein [Fimbriimonadaceae bacterium]|nr:DNA-formamidopyrimidine glycosylase family protein [Fimbriimonadaceae bacterium]
MPEYPDINLYLESLRPRVVGHPLERMRFFNPFVLRTVEPSPREVEGKFVEGVERIGKRIVLTMAGDVFVVIHLMIAGRLRWNDQKKETKSRGKIALAQFDFPTGALTLTEVSSHKRASVSLISGRQELQKLDPGGLDVFKVSLKAFKEKLTSENRTMKRALTNPKWFDGIGNAYSDEILHAARLSPLRLTRSLSDVEIETLLGACRKTLAHWAQKLLDEFAGKFPGPGDVTAFRPDFAAHGKFGQPCLVCGKPIQRIRYAENETNYCAVCQNEGRMLADRSLSRLLKDDWPKTIQEMVGD